MLSIDHWHYFHGKPDVTATFKTLPEDFIVTEELGYQPSGEGEHIYLWVEKVGLNTAYVAEQIAKFTGLPLRNVTYAGRKDKYALTYQWIAVHKPGKTEYPWQDFKLEGCRILKAIRHNKKLRTGVLKGNTFKIVLRKLSTQDGLEERLTQIKEKGVPNYFGSQRFGESQNQTGGNLALAEKMLAGEAIRNRNKRSMAISAMRAWVFNEFISQRLATHVFESPMDGDVMNLSGSNSFFVCEQVSKDELDRLATRDILLTAPMWGAGKLAAINDALSFEQALANKHQALYELLEELGLKQERRPIRLFAENIHWQIDAGNLTISFTLPSGAFATSVLREVVQLINRSTPISSTQ